MVSKNYKFQGSFNAEVFCEHIIVASAVLFIMGMKLQRDW